MKPAEFECVPHVWMNRLISIFFWEMIVMTYWNWIKFPNDTGHKYTIFDFYSLSAIMNLDSAYGTLFHGRECVRCTLSWSYWHADAGSYFSSTETSSIGIEYGVRVWKKKIKM